MRIPKKIPAINAGSMADIAFLLLVFFLVTTKIETDFGLKAVLPAWESDIRKQAVPERNVHRIVLNAANELAVEDRYFEISELKEDCLHFILNYASDRQLSDNPKKAILLFQHDKASDYAAYLAVYNELQAAYNQIWETIARKRYRKAYESLPKAVQLEIRKEFPKQIVEPNPSTVGIANIQS